MLRGEVDLNFEAAGRSFYRDPKRDTTEVETLSVTPQQIRSTEFQSIISRDPRIAVAVTHTVARILEIAKDEGLTQEAKKSAFGKLAAGLEAAFAQRGADAGERPPSRLSAGRRENEPGASAGQGRAKS